MHRRPPSTLKPRRRPWSRLWPPPRACASPRQTRRGNSLEVFATEKERLYDSEVVTATTLDWNYSDQKGQRLADGDYRYTLSVKGEADEWRAHSGRIKLRDGAASVTRDTAPEPLANQVVDGDIIFTSPDAYAEKHRIQVEEEKMGEERGTYLHPEAFGQPKEKGVTHARHSASRPQPKEETSKETTAAKRVITGQQ